MNAVVTALKEVDDQTAEMLRGIIRPVLKSPKSRSEELAPAKSPGADSEIRRRRESRGSPACSGRRSGCHCQGSAARHAPKLRGSRHRGSAE